jgi:hypothetical protein
MTAAATTSTLGFRGAARLMAFMLRKRNVLTMSNAGTISITSAISAVPRSVRAYG